MAIRDERGYTKLTIEIGDWDMDTVTAVNVVNPLSATEWKTIRSIKVIIRNDNDNQYGDLDSLDTSASGLMNGGILYFNSSTIRLGRYTGGLFDSVGWDSTGYNRGWLTIEYIAD